MRVVPSILVLAFTLSVSRSLQAFADPTAASVFDSVELGGHLEISTEHLRDLDLDSSEEDDLDLLPIELELELLFEPSDSFLAYVRSQIRRQFVLRSNGDEDADSTEILLNEAYVTLTNAETALSLQLGRQLFEDQRQWFYEAELDAIRGRYQGAGLVAELSASRQALLVDEDLLNDVDEDSAVNVTFHALHALSKAASIGGYAILRDNNDSDVRTIHLGLTSSGTPISGFSYWADAALLRGEEGGQSLRGYGVDVFGAYRFEAPLSPRVLGGIALGSGRSDSEEIGDTGFRQTGLQDNEAELGSLASFHYYGEAFDPELANIAIYTAGMGIRPSPDLTMDLIYHHYRQDQASETLRDSGLDAEPTGSSPTLGNEVDLVIGYQATEDLLVTSFVGYFNPGKGFDADADDALIARLELEYGL
jgi:alginate production protein